LNCVDNFYPWKDIVGKKVSKLRSIAELRAFYGITFKKQRENLFGRGTIKSKKNLSPNPHVENILRLRQFKLRPLSIIPSE
jgi:hypothetical protein